jgi:hypothetical protein
MRNVLFIGAASMLFSACTASEVQETEELNGEAYGMITIPSIVTSSSGNVYAFDIPQIDVSGENGQHESFSFMSESWENQVYEIDLAVGEYMVMLHEPNVFRLDESGEFWEHVDAEMVSDNPQWVGIFANETSHVEFVFMVNGEEVEFSSGSLDIQLDVVENEPDDADPYEDDMDGDGHLTWTDCNDHDPTVYLGAPEVLDGLDNDCDGLVDEGIDANLYDMDSDDDGLSDGEEIDIYGTDPYNVDSDWDGLSDLEEVHIFGTDPNNWDTDGDILSDFEEVYIYGTDPTEWDEDGDGMWTDTDGDGLYDEEEIYFFGTDPLSADSDWDGLTDFEEVAIYGTDPLNPDTNGNGIFDGDDF